MKRCVTGKVLLFTKKNGCFFSRILSSAPELPARVLARRAHVAEAYFEVGGPALAGRGERAVARAPERRLARLAARVFLSRASRAHRVWQSRIPVNSAHTSTHVFFWSAPASAVTRPEPGRGRLCSAAYLSRDASSRWPSTESMPLSRCRQKSRARRRRGRVFVSHTLHAAKACVRAARSKTRAWNLTSDRRAADGVPRATDRARRWLSRRASRPRVRIVSARARTCHRFVAIAVLSPKYPVGSSFRYPFLERNRCKQCTSPP